MRRAVARVRSLVQGSPEPLYRPDFGDTAFIRRLVGGVDAWGAAGPLQHGAPGTDPVGMAVSRFRTRVQPRFFVSPAEVPGLVARVEREWPARAEATRRTARQLLGQGLEVYGTRTRPLQDLDWAALPCGPGDDVLYRVHAHFFRFAPRLALAAAHGEDTLDAMERLLRSWTDYAAYGSDPLPYASSLTITLRLVALAWTLTIVQGLAHASRRDVGALELLLLKVVHADALALASRGAGEAANNHVLVCRFGQWFAGMLLPEVPAMQPSRDVGERLWMEEVRRQTFPDGGGFEHATRYHTMLCETAIAYALLQRRNGGSTPGWLMDRLAAMVEFQAALGAPGRSRFGLGDSSDLALFPFWDGDGVGGLAACHRLLFDRRLDVGGGEDGTEELAFWLGGGGPGGGEASRAPARRAFADSGVYLLGDHETGSRMLFRTGPSPGRSIFAGHSHADLLSVQIAVDGRPMLVDAGTYTYRSGGQGWPPGSRQWRRYLRGPAAHNGLSIEGSDPLGDGRGDFRDPASRSVVEVRHASLTDGLEWVEGCVAGETAYAGYRRGLVHVVGEYWLVYDLLPERLSPAPMSLNFQFASHAAVRAAAGSSWEIARDGRCLALHPSAGLPDPRLLCGAEAPVGGWVSERYGSIEPAPQLRFPCPAEVTLVAFLLSAGAAGARTRSLDVSPCHDGVALRTQREDEVDIVLLRNSGSSGPAEGLGISLAGDAAWLRVVGGVPQALRCLDTEACHVPAHAIEVRAARPAPYIDVRRAGAERTAVARGADLTRVRWPS